MSNIAKQHIRIMIYFYALFCFLYTIGLLIFPPKYFSLLGVEVILLIPSSLYIFSYLFYMIKMNKKIFILCIVVSLVEIISFWAGIWYFGFQLNDISCPFEIYIIPIIASIILIPSLKMASLYLLKKTYNESYIITFKTKLSMLLISIFLACFAVFAILHADNLFSKLVSL